jgi:hypothetical protein
MLKKLISKINFGKNRTLIYFRHLQIMFCIFFSVQNPSSFLGDVGHTFNKLSVKNQKAKLSVLDCKNLLSLSILFLMEETTLFSSKKNPGF